MTCTVSELELQSYADGELPAARAREIEAHAGECLQCARFLEGERALAARVAALPRAIAPSPELWKSIEARMAPPLRQVPPRIVARRTWWKPAAGGVALAAAAALIFLATRPKVQAPEGPVATVVAPPPAPPPAPQVITLPEEQPYLAALAAMETDFAARKGSLSPEAARDVDANLRILDAAIESTRNAAQAHPDNLDLKSQLADIYQQKIHVESDVIDLTARI